MQVSSEWQDAKIETGGYIEAGCLDGSKQKKPCPADMVPDTPSAAFTD